MAIKLGVVMDPIGEINYHKDSTLAMLLAASKHDWELYYMEPVSYTHLTLPTICFKC